MATHHPVACLGLRASFAPACRVPLAQWLERCSYDPQVAGSVPARNNVVQDGNGSWSGCAFLPACSRFLPFRHLLPWLLAHLQMPPSGQADSGTAPLSNSWKLLGRPNAVLQPCSKGRTRRRTDKPLQKVAMHHPVACLGLRASRVLLAQWLERCSYEP